MNDLNKSDVLDLIEGSMLRVDEDTYELYASEISDACVLDQEMYEMWCNTTSDPGSNMDQLFSINLFFRNIGLPYHAIEMDRIYEEDVLLTLTSV